MEITEWDVGDIIMLVGLNVSDARHPRILVGNNLHNHWGFSFLFSMHEIG